MGLMVFHKEPFPNATLTVKVDAMIHTYANTATVKVEQDVKS